MSGWLAVAEKLFGRPAAELPTSYTIECACGRQVSGTRSAADQVSFCAACGTALFILPHSVYPRPRGVPVEPVASSRPGSAPQRRRIPKPAEEPREAVRKSGPPADDIPTPPQLAPSHPFHEPIRCWSVRQKSTWRVCGANS